MFLRKNENQPAVAEKTEEKNPAVQAAAPAAVQPVPPVLPKETSLDSLKELLEKNLKWSQIIYEQNRRLNNKLLWSAIADWLRILLIIIPLALALIYLPPLLGNVWSQYADLLDTGGNTQKADPTSLNSLFKTLNIDPAKQEQIKALIK